MKVCIFLISIFSIKTFGATVLEPTLGYSRLVKAYSGETDLIMSGFVVGGKVGFQKENSTYGLRALFAPSLDAQLDPVDEAAQTIIDAIDISYSQIGLFSQSSINESLNFFFGFDFSYKIKLEASGVTDESDAYNLYAGASFKISENFQINGEVGYLIPEESEDKADLPLTTVISISSPIPF
tara:strand:+ start:432 stop:977 length:546 start_codon:yes stop_codon:yes gene_type:complete